MMKEMKYVFLLCLIVILSSCQKSDIMLYQQRAGVYFSTYEYAYSFAEHPGGDSAVLRLPVEITGSPVDYRREFKVTLPSVDTLTTAESDQYRIGTGIVEAGEQDGFVDLTIYRDSRLKDSVYKVYLCIQKTPDFPEVRLNRFFMSVSFTEKIIKPVNWEFLNLGPFSSAWWKFILEVPGGHTLPYWMGGPINNPSNPDPEYWNMSLGELATWRTVIRNALNEYNAGPDGPLMHDDYSHAGEPVQMPNE